MFSPSKYIFSSHQEYWNTSTILCHILKKNTFCSGKGQKGINTLLRTEPNARRMFESNQKILSWTVHIASNLSVPFILWWYFLFAKTRVCTFMCTCWYHIISYPQKSYWNCLPRKKAHCRLLTNKYLHLTGYSLFKYLYLGISMF